MYFDNELLDFIAERYGTAAAADVQDNFGGESFYITKKKPVDAAQALIEANFGQMDARQLARATGLSVRAVQLRLNRPVSKAQVSLPF
jgi:hypothetical protein